MGEHLPEELCGFWEHPSPAASSQSGSSASVKGIFRGTSQGNQ